MSEEYRNKMNENTKISVRKTHYKRSYGITIDEYNEMFEKQCGRCAICGGKHLGIKNMAIDHCHKTNRVRGLLCPKCNLGLGFFRDNIDILKLAQHYLNKYLQ